jgi:vancomycin resistance protein YoaR
LGTAALAAVTNQLGSYLSGPITLSYADTETVIDQKTIISWIEVGARPTKQFMISLDLADLYPPPAAANLGLSKTAVKQYVTDLAAQIDQTAQNAGLAMKDGALAIVQPSRTGIKLDQTDATTAITASLKRSSGDRLLSLKLETTQAPVNESNLDSLGIKEQISEGETYFPGSPSTRLTNVRAGAKRFNGILLAPGETFSFGKLLGAVGPETGYVPELVILADHEEKQYGGGLCQVSSTAFRAALAAGLPITQRSNHAFAISYYTWPYSAPGVDATIYYPAVDFKFVNDTGHYILMQTVMNGMNLKFDFFGTKTKTGVLRGPNFITGTNDATQPSRTVFYRDVLDLAGAVTKTDTFFTNYKSSKDFPITKQFN